MSLFPDTVSVLAPSCCFNSSLPVCSLFSPLNHPFFTWWLFDVVHVLNGPLPGFSLGLFSSIQTLLYRLATPLSIVLTSKNPLTPSLPPAPQIFRTAVAPSPSRFFHLPFDFFFFQPPIRNRGSFQRDCSCLRLVPKLLFCAAHFFLSCRTAYLSPDKRGYPTSGCIVIRGSQRTSFVRGASLVLFLSFFPSVF